MRQLLILAVASIVVTVGPSGGSAAPNQVVDRIEVSATCSGTQCTLTIRNTGPRGLHLVGVVVPGGATLAGVTGSNGGRCETQNNFSTCYYSSGGQPTFAAGQTRTLIFTSSTPLAPGTKIGVCASGRADGGDLFWTYPEVEAAPVGAESDLELEIKAKARVRMKGKYYGYAAYDLFVTNHGPSTSTGGRLTVRYSRPPATLSEGWSRNRGKPMTCGKAVRRVVWICRLPELHRGEKAYYHYLMHHHIPGRFFMRGTVVGVHPDPVKPNNRAQVRVEVVR